MYVCTYLYLQVVQCAVESFILSHKLVYKEVGHTLSECVGVLAVSTGALDCDWPPLLVIIIPQPGSNHTSHSGLSNRYHKSSLQN